MDHFDNFTYEIVTWHWLWPSDLLIYNLSYSRVIWTTCITLHTHFYVTLILTWWPTCFYFELQSWNLDHLDNFTYKIVAWPWHWSGDLLIYILSYSIEIWTTCKFLHTNLLHDLAFDLLTYLFICWTISLKLGPLAQFGLTYFLYGDRYVNLIWHLTLIALLFNLMLVFFYQAHRIVERAVLPTALVYSLF